MVKCLISDSTDPWFNLAVEDWIFNNLEEETLFLWRNAECVIIGRNQNPWAECDVNRMKQDGINLVRRETGGGTVFQDLGNSIFSFLSKEEDYDKDSNFGIVVSALKKMGIEAVQEGRNDIVVNDRKISGSAFKTKNGKSLHHGTLLIDADIAKLSGYLTPHAKKLESKGTKSVAKRVVNVREIVDVDHDKFCEALIEEYFASKNTEKNVQILDKEDLARIPELKEKYEFLKSHDWIFGESPEFTHKMEERFDWGLVEVNLLCESGIVKDSKIFSDALNAEMIHALAESFKGISYDKKEFVSKVNELSDRMPHERENLNSFSSWISAQVG